jgi:hypothetical protein
VSSQMNFVSWPDDSGARQPHLVAPSSGDNKSVNTIMLPPSKTYIFWASPNLLTPVSEGWYIHAVSVQGRDQQFDITGDQSARWEHYQIGSDGLIALRLIDDRTYVFYVTPKNADQDALKRGHIPWDARAFRVSKAAQTDHILIPAQPLMLDDHGKALSHDENFDHETTLEPLLAFESDEHLNLGQSAQRMLDYWAVNGLIDGGALVDSSAANPNAWNILIPYEPSDSTAARPYGSVWAASHYHWHYILPDAKVDASRRPWTAASLKKAIIAGDAAAVTVGQLLCLTGDYYSSLEDMCVATAREPVNIMKGFEEDDRFAYMIIDVMNFERWGYGMGSLYFMDDVKKNQKDAEKAEKENREKVKTLVSVLRQARGKSRFSEIHLLAQMWSGKSGAERKTTGFSLTELVSRLPWFNPDQNEIARVLGPVDFIKVNDPGFDEEFFSMVVTNGHYAQLALDNAKHFDPANWDEFAKYHGEALALIDRHAKHSGAHRNPIPAESVARTACGLHFLTDSFSSGHMRVPRAALGKSGALSAKLMHDMDGLYGLHVRNDFGTHWRAFGDGHLDPSTITGAPQIEMMQRLRVSAETNQTKAQELVGSAFKQLHLEAQKVCSADPRFRAILQDSKGDHPTQLRWDKVALGAASSQDTIGRKITETVSERIAYMGKLRPKPVEVGQEIEKNHPPLFLESGELNTAAKAYVKVTPLKFFEVHLHWHLWSITRDPKRQVSVDFTKFYQLAIHTQGAGGWVGGGETKLLELYEKLPKA